MDNLKIVALKAENIKKLVAVEIRPDPRDGALVQITGANGQGKSSILDAIFWALAGKGAAQAEPIRNGQKEARIKLDLGEIIVKRAFKKTDDGEITTSISVESKEGAKFPSPQALLDKLIGSLSFDPLAFSRMKPREQFDELKRLVPGVDFEAIEAANKADFEKRTELNRKAKALRAQQAALAVAEEGPIERIDEAALVSKLEAAGNTNAEIERKKANREAAALKVAENQKRAADIVDELNDETRRIQEETARRLDDLLKKAGDEQSKLLQEAGELKKKLEAAPPLAEPIDTAAVRSEIEKARAENRIRRDREAKVEARDAADKLEAEASGMTEAMESRDKNKRAKIEAAKLPVAGLGFGDGIVTIGGVPFVQASSAEQLRTSIAIAMSLNPKLRVIRVQDGSLLDQKSLHLLSEMATTNDFQVWVERVDASGKVGFIVEDGTVRPAMAEAAV